MSTKHIAVLASLLLSAMQSGAACIEKTDTLLLREVPSRAIITESPSGIKLTVGNPDNGSDTTTVCLQEYGPDVNVATDQETITWTHLKADGGAIGVRASHHWDIISGGLAIGLVNAQGQPEGLGLQWKKSIEISWINALAVRYSTHLFSMSFGLGFSWKNFRTTLSSHCMIPDGHGGVGTAPYPEGSQPGASRIKVFSLGLPLLLTQRIPSTSLSVTLGGILNFNTHASLKTWYTDASAHHNDISNTRSIGQRKISIDLFGSINLWKGSGLFVRWSPQTVLRRGYGSPEFKSLSVGAVFFL